MTFRRVRSAGRPPSRGRLVGVLVALAALAAACTSGGQATDRRASGLSFPAPRRPGDRPNVVFVLADDLSSNLVPFMPHVAALEGQGMRFTNYTVTDSLCCPSRASIFTGDFPHDTHVYTNQLPYGGFLVFHRRGEENRTFAAALTGVGYRTALIGKYLNNYNPNVAVDGGQPYVPPGWSEWGASGDHGYRGFNYPIADNHALKYYGHAPGDYLTTVIDQRARAFITDSAHTRTPFLLEVATYTPHKPYVPAPADVGKFPGLRAPKTPAFDTLPTSPPRWLAGHQPLSAADRRKINHDFRLRVEDVQSIDRMIGNLEATLVRTGQAANTYFVFTSDNGYHMGEYRLTPGKMTAFDTDIRVPLVVTGPGVPAGVASPAVTENVDLAPTFEAIAHARIPTHTDGTSLLPLLHGQPRPRNWPRFSLIEHHGPDRSPNDADYPAYGSGNPPSYRAIRSRSFVYVEYAGGTREYYDLRTDPYELHNLASSLSRRYRHRLHHAILAMANCHNARQCTTAAQLPRH